jgi:hypothetical protein
MSAPLWLTSRCFRQAAIGSAAALGLSGGILALVRWLHQLERSYDELMASAFQDPALADGESSEIRS